MRLPIKETRKAQDAGGLHEGEEFGLRWLTDMDLELSTGIWSSGRRMRGKV